MDKLTCPKCGHPLERRIGKAFDIGREIAALPPEGSRPHEVPLFDAVIYECTNLGTTCFYAPVGIEADDHFIADPSMMALSQFMSQVMRHSEEKKAQQHPKHDPGE